MTDDMIGASLRWRRAGAGWQLFDGRRRFGEVLPDSKHPGMWRSVLSGGRLSDMANLSWVKHAVMDAAVREIEWSARRRAAIAPPFTGQNEGVFSAPAGLSDLNAPGAPRVGAAKNTRPGARAMTYPDELSDLGLDDAQLRVVAVHADAVADPDDRWRFERKVAELLRGSAHREITNTDVNRAISIALQKCNLICEFG